MPELPEVETVRRGLSTLLVDRVLERVEVLNPKLRFGVPKSFARDLTGRRVIAIDRRAKYLLIRTDGPTVLSHLGMTGTWQKTDRPLAKHDHLRLVLDDGTALIYNDPRKFGFVDFVTSDDHPRLRVLGPEPLSEAFSAPYLRERFRKRAAPIKSLLMDQGIVVGVGNIYAAEALFRALIHPLARAGRVKEERLAQLVSAVRAVLTEAIAAGGSSIDDFMGTGGESGYFQNTHAVYGKEGLPCPRCKAVLKQKVIGGRSSVFCATCQKR